MTSFNDLTQAQAYYLYRTRQKEGRYLTDITLSQLRSGERMKIYREAARYSLMVMFSAEDRKHVRIRKHRNGRWYAVLTKDSSRL